MGRILQPSKVESRNEITHAILLESPEVYDVLRVSLVVVEGHIEVAPGVVHGVRRRVVLGRVPPAERRDLSARRLEVVELALAALADEDAGDDHVLVSVPVRCGVRGIGRVGALAGEVYALSCSCMST